MDTSASTPVPDATSLQNQIDAIPLKDQPEGAAVLNVAQPGGGKTYVLPTLIEAGLDLFVVGTENRFTESLLDSMSDRKLPMSKLHYVKVEPMKTDWAGMINVATTINRLSFESLSGLKSGIDKAKFDQFIILLKALENFHCDHCGRSFGAVDSWGPDRALAIDGLSGMNMMALDLVIGGKPTAAQGEWGVAMNNEERLIHKLTSDTRCFFVLNAHVEREGDPVSGGSSIQVAALGQKLAPKIPRFFSEVVLSHREGTQYWWSTITPMYALKRRALPLSDKIPPTYVPLVQAWRKRLDQLKEGKSV